MSELTVHNVTLKHYSEHTVTVTLYCNGSVVGHCEPQPDSYPPVLGTLGCDKVLADQVMLVGMETATESYLKVYEVGVRVARNKTIACPAPVIVNGTVTPEGSITNGASYSVICDTGFVLNGRSVLTCSNVCCSYTGTLGEVPSCLEVAPTEGPTEMGELHSSSGTLQSTAYTVLIFLLIVFLTLCQVV